MGYLTLYARIQNLVKCEAPGAKITDYIVQRGRLGATVTVQAVGPGNIRTTIKIELPLSPKNFGISQTKQGNSGLKGCFL